MLENDRDTTEMQRQGTAVHPPAEQNQTTAPPSPLAVSQAAEHEVRLRALGQMASGIAHDLNNSLTPIIGFSDYLLDTQPNLPADSRQCLQCIRTAAGDIAQLVERIRLFYRRRGPEEVIQPLNLSALAQQALEAFRPHWRELSQKQGIRFRIKTEVDEGPSRILGNENEVKEAIEHLLRNAVEAMPEGGTISVAVRAIPAPPGGPDRTMEPPSILLEVRDTGTGMDEATRERCFDPFFSTKGARGRGLGLAQVYGVMRRHEGIAEVDSQLGKGTTARLLFPAYLSPAEAEKTTAAASKTDSVPMVCIVEDRLHDSRGQVTLTKTAGV